MSSSLRPTGGGSLRETTRELVTSSGVWGTLRKGAYWLELAEKERSELPARGTTTQSKAEGPDSRHKQRGPSKGAKAGGALKVSCQGRPLKGAI